MPFLTGYIGDHGAINSWDRMPFLHDLHESGTPSFTPLPTTIANNFIFANYGSSQGVDNDDGSSHFNTHDNVFYMADGFKMVRTPGVRLQWCCSFFFVCCLGGKYCGMIPMEGKRETKRNVIDSAYFFPSFLPLRRVLRLIALFPPSRPLFFPLSVFFRGPAGLWWARLCVPLQLGN